MVELSEKQLKLIGFKCDSNCHHIGLSVRELSAKFPDYLANILFINAIHLFVPALLARSEASTFTSSSSVTAKQ